MPQGLALYNVLTSDEISIRTQTVHYCMVLFRHRPSVKTLAGCVGWKHTLVSLDEGL